MSDYSEISDFTGYVDVHTEQDSNQLQRAVFSAVSDQRVEISGLDDLASELERSLWGELARDYGILVFIFVFSLINLANTPLPIFSPASRSSVCSSPLA